MPAPIAPIRISAYTATSAVGVGQCGAARRARRPSAAGCGPTTSGPRRWPPGSAGSTGSKRPLPRGAGALGLPQPPPGLAGAAGRRLPGRGGRGAQRATARRASRLIARHLDLQHRRHRGRLPRSSTPTAASRPTLRSARCTRRIRCGLSCSRRSGSKGRAYGVDRLLVERQGVRVGRAAVRLRAGRRGRRRRRRHAVRQRAVRLQLAGTGVARALPALRRRAQRHQPGEAAGFALLERGAGRAAAASGYGEAERRAPHVEPAPRGPGRRARARRRAGPRRLATRRRSTTSTCTAPPAPRTTRSRPRWWRGASGAHHACQLDQGLHRPHAGRRRHRRGGDQPAGAARPG